MAAQKKKRRRSRRKLPVTLVAVLLVCGIIAAIIAAMNGYFTDDNEKETFEKPPQVVDKSSVTMHFIDVGQADSILIVAPEGNMLIDAGTNSSEGDLKNYLDSLGIKKFKYAVFTHPHEDHIGGADMIMENYEVENVILPDAVATTKTYQRMMDAIEKSKANVIQAVPGEAFYIGALKNTILAPVTTEGKDANNTSVVIRTEYGETSMMFTGDAEAESEAEILEKFDKSGLKCDLLKMGHHGSTTSSSDAFLEAVSPSIAVISCGVDNSYGHPHAETITKLEKLKIRYYRTDLLGSIVFKSDGKQIEFVSNSGK